MNSIVHVLEKIFFFNHCTLTVIYPFNSNLPIGQFDLDICFNLLGFSQEPYNLIDNSSCTKYLGLEGKRFELRS